MPGKEDDPLQSEQLNRDKWRDGGERGADEAEGNLPPESDHSADDEHGGGGQPVLPTPMPPD